MSQALPFYVLADREIRNGNIQMQNSTRQDISTDDSDDDAFSTTPSVKVDSKRMKTLLASLKNLPQSRSLPSLVTEYTNFSLGSYILDVISAALAFSYPRSSDWSVAQILSAFCLNSPSFKQRMLSSLRDHKFKLQIIARGSLVTQFHDLSVSTITDVLEKRRRVLYLEVSMWKIGALSDDHCASVISNLLSEASDCISYFFERVSKVLALNNNAPFTELFSFTEYHPSQFSLPLLSFAFSHCAQDLFGVIPLSTRNCPVNASFVSSQQKSDASFFVSPAPPLLPEFRDVSPITFLHQIVHVLTPLIILHDNSEQTRIDANFDGVLLQTPLATSIFTVFGKLSTLYQKESHIYASVFNQHDRVLARKGIAVSDTILNDMGCWDVHMHTLTDAFNDMLGSLGIKSSVRMLHQDESLRLQNLGKSFLDIPFAGDNADELGLYVSMIDLDIKRDLRVGDLQDLGQVFDNNLTKESSVVTYPRDRTVHYTRCLTKEQYSGLSDSVQQCLLTIYETMFPSNYAPSLCDLFEAFLEAPSVGALSSKCYQRVLHMMLPLLRTGVDVTFFLYITRRFFNLRSPDLLRELHRSLRFTLYNAVPTDVTVYYRCARILAILVVNNVYADPILSCYFPLLYNGQANHTPLQYTILNKIISLVNSRQNLHTITQYSPFLAEFVKFRILPSRNVLSFLRGTCKALKGQKFNSQTTHLVALFFDVMRDCGRFLINANEGARVEIMTIYSELNEYWKKTQFANHASEILDRYTRISLWGIVHEADVCETDQHTLNLHLIEFFRQTYCNLFKTPLPLQWARSCLSEACSCLVDYLSVCTTTPWDLFVDGMQRYSDDNIAFSLNMLATRTLEANLSRYPDVNDVIAGLLGPISYIDFGSDMGAFGSTPDSFLKRMVSECFSAALKNRPGELKEYCTKYKDNFFPVSINSDAIPAYLFDQDTITNDNYRFVALVISRMLTSQNASLRLGAERTIDYFVNFCKSNFRGAGRGRLTVCLLLLVELGRHKAIDFKTLTTILRDLILDGGVILAGESFARTSVSCYGITSASVALANTLRACYVPRSNASPTDFTLLYIAFKLLGELISQKLVATMLLTATFKESEDASESPIAKAKEYLQKATLSVDLNDLGDLYSLLCFCSQFRNTEFPYYFERETQKFSRSVAEYNRMLIAGENIVSGDKEAVRKIINLVIQCTPGSSNELDTERRVVTYSHCLLHAWSSYRIVYDGDVVTQQLELQRRIMLD